MFTVITVSIATHVNRDCERRCFDMVERLTLKPDSLGFIFILEDKYLSSGCYALNIHNGFCTL